MTIERAIKILDPTHREHYDSIETVNEACRMGMQALEKQLAKKPTVENGFVEYFRDWICPSCGEQYDIEYDVFKFCPNCGQAIDWSEEK